MASVKRSRRDPIERAHKSGYQASIKGKSSGTCPFKDPDKRGAWLCGWNEGNVSSAGTHFI